MGQGVGGNGEDAGVDFYYLTLSKRCGITSNNEVPQRLSNMSKQMPDTPARGRCEGQGPIQP